MAIENINIPRCYKPTDFNQIVEYTLHYFSDASETGYGQASSLRMINENGDLRCCLIYGKSRVAPVKYVSIPRPELTAATLSVKEESWIFLLHQKSFEQIVKSLWVK